MWEIEVERESVRAAALELHTADVHFTGVCNIFRNLDCKSPLSVEKIGKRKKNFQLISTAFSPFFLLVIKFFRRAESKHQYQTSQRLFAEQPQHRKLARMHCLLTFIQQSYRDNLLVQLHCNNPLPSSSNQAVQLKCGCVHVNMHVCLSRFTYLHELLNTGNFLTLF